MSVRPTPRLVVHGRLRMLWLLVAVLGCERGGVFSTIELRKASLRNDVDHQAVLEGCRVLANDPSLHGEHEGTDPRLPPALRALSPKRVHVDADHVSVLLVSHGGHLDTTLGLSCFEKDPQGEGGEEIAPGLWLWHYRSGEDVTRTDGLGRRRAAPPDP